MNTADLVVISARHIFQRIAWRSNTVGVRMRTGDTIKHDSSDWHWTIAYVDGERLAFCELPPGELMVSDCVLVKSCSDEEYVEVLRTLAFGPEGKRATLAQRALAETVMGLLVGEKDSPDI